MAACVWQAYAVVSEVQAAAGLPCTIQSLHHCFQAKCRYRYLISARDCTNRFLAFPDTGCYLKTTASREQNTQMLHMASEPAVLVMRGKMADERSEFCSPSNFFLDKTHTGHLWINTPGCFVQH